MTMMRGYDGEPTVKVEIDTETELRISAGTSICGGMTASVTALGHIERIKYCPFCGKNLQED